MRLESLQLSNVRCFDSKVISLSEGITFFTGSNGKGKTTFLEAVYLLCHHKSFRTHRIENIVRDGRAEFSIEGGFRTDEKLLLQKKLHFTAIEKKKTLYLNKKKTTFLEYRRCSQKPHCVIFSPLDHQMIRGGPENRREAFDQLSAAISEEYAFELAQYQQALKQRNAVLRAALFRKTPPNKDELRVYTQLLVNHGSRLQIQRQNRSNDLREKIAELFKNINESDASLELLYFPDLEAKDLALTTEIEDKFSHALSLSRKDEIAQGNTLSGPHRDDWGFSFNGKNLREFGSQGQTRTAILAFKLAEINLFGQQAMEKPIFLLDDFSSELDEGRRRQLLEYLVQRDIQVLVTTTERQIQKDAFVMEVS